MKISIFKNYYIILTNLLLFLFYFSISSFTPYQADDFIFKINPLDSTLSLENFSSAIKSVWYWYNYWTGRAFGIFLVTSFLIPDKIFFDFANSIIQILLVNIIFYYSRGHIAKSKSDSTILLLINFLLVVGLYGYVNSVFIVTFSINTTWTHTYTLLYYLLFLKYWDDKRNYLKNFFFFIFGILSGWGLEQVFIAQLFLFLLIYFLKVKNKLSNLPTYTLSSFLGIMVGGMSLMLAPGNYSRAKFSGYEFSFDFGRIFNFLRFELDWFYYDIKLFWIISVILSIIYYFVYKEKFKINDISIIVLITGFISSFSLVLSPSYHKGVNIFLYYCLLIFFISIFNYKSILRKNLLKFVFYFQIISLFIFNGYLLVNQIKIFNYAKAIETEIIEKKQNGEENIVVKQINLKTNRFINYLAMFDVTSDLRNEGIARYYNVKTIRAIK